MRKEQDRVRFIWSCKQERQGKQRGKEYCKVIGCRRNIVPPREGGRRSCGIELPAPMIALDEQSFLGRAYFSGTEVYFRVAFHRRPSPKGIVRLCRDLNHRPGIPPQCIDRRARRDLFGFAFVGFRVTPALDEMTGSISLCVANRLILQIKLASMTNDLGESGIRRILRLESWRPSR